MNELKNKLLDICQRTNIERKNKLIDYLDLLNVRYNNHDMALVVPSTEQNVILLTAHYDVYPNSFGYNDNGMSLLIILEIIKTLPQNIEVVFTNEEECGGGGADYYVKSTTKNIIGCINLDVCGIGDYLYCDNYNSNIIPKDCKIGIMPFNDGHIFNEYKIPTLTFSTSYKDMEFRDGINTIWQSIHNNKNDNNIEIINFGLVDIVSKKIKDTIKCFEKKDC